VDRGVLEEQDPRWNLDAGLDDLQHGATTGAIGPPVEQRWFDVVPPAQRIEVERLVPIQRGLVPEPFPRRIGIVVDAHVVRVVVDGYCRVCRGHGVVPIGRSSGDPAHGLVVL